MIIFKKQTDITSFLLAKTNQQLTTGFVPTMGALHSGHIGLVKRARQENALVICSIFVNPTQFNDPKDFEKYPSTIENDTYLLEKAGCDVLFLPSVQEMYPDGFTKKRQYDLGALEHELEGRYRPGHFQGVCQVVHRLLDIMRPGKLYLGQKDFQQCMVIKKLISLIGFETVVVVCPTQREPDGLAMSSRNLRLNPEERKKATGIYEVLKWIKQHINNTDIPALKVSAVKTLTDKGFKVDYVEIAETNNLRMVEKSDGEKPLVVLAAAYLNEVRLIDNMILDEDATRT